MSQKNGKLRVYELVIPCKRYKGKKSKMDEIFKISSIGKDRVEATDLIFKDTRFIGFQEVLIKYTRIRLSKSKVQNALNLKAIISNRLVIGKVS